MSGMAFRALHAHTVRSQPVLQRMLAPPATLRAGSALTLRRALSTGGNSGGVFDRALSARARVASLMTSANENRYVLLTIGAATLGMYGFYRVTVRITGFLLHVSDATIFNIGFGAGVFTAAAIVVTAVATHRYTSLSVDGLKRVALLAAQQDGQQLGSQYFEASHPNFRAYTFESLRDAVFGSELRARSSYMQLPARRCRLMFLVHGSVHDGVIAVEGYKRNGAYHIDAMSLFVTDTGQTVVLKGDEARAQHALFGDVLGLKKQAKRARAPDHDSIDPFR
jgi:hypothetical protein